MLILPTADAASGKERAPKLLADVARQRVHCTLVVFGNGRVSQASGLVTAGGGATRYGRWSRTRTQQGRLRRPRGRPLTVAA